MYAVHFLSPNKLIELILVGNLFKLETDVINLVYSMKKSKVLCETCGD